MGRGALEGLKVLDVGDFVSGPFCARLLGDLGAEVTKVETLTGDTARRYGPFPNDIPSSEASGLFLALNFNKMGVTLEPQTPTGRRLLHRLVEESDIVVANTGLKCSRGTDLDFRELRAANPRAIVTAITPFGLEGKYSTYAGYDINVNSVGGASFSMGLPEREPLMFPALQSGMLAGLAAAFASVVGALGRSMTGHGQLIDVAEAQVMGAFNTGGSLPRYLYQGYLAWRNGRRATVGHFPQMILPCKDGFVQLFTPQIEQYLRWLSIMGEQEWTKNPKYRNRRAMLEEYPDEAEALIQPWFSQHTKEELLKLYLKNRVPSAPVRDIKEVVEDVHLCERGFFQQVDHPVAGRLAYPGYQFRMSATPLGIQCSAPTLGQHNYPVYCERLGCSREELAQLRNTGVI